MRQGARLTLLAWLFGCQPAVARFAIGTAPVVHSFIASPGEVTEGETVQLAADFTGGTATIAALGSITTQASAIATLAPLLDQAVTTYVLTVTSAEGTVTTAKASVLVHRAPSAFAILTPASGEAGQLLSASVESQPGISFAWQVSGAALVSVASGESVLISATQLTDITITCVATNALGRTMSAQTLLPVTGVVLVAGDLTQAGWVDGQGSAARFGTLTGITDDGAGGAYASDSSNALIRHIDAQGNVTTFAGTPQAPGFQDGASAKFASPMGLALLPDGDLLVADRTNHALRKVSAGITSTAVTLGTDQPFAIARAHDGTLLVSSARTSAGIALSRYSQDLATSTDVVREWQSAGMGSVSFAADAISSGALAGDPAQGVLDRIGAAGEVSIIAGHVPNAVGATATYGVFFSGPMNVLSDGSGGAFAFDSAEASLTPATRLLHVGATGNVETVLGTTGIFVYRGIENVAPGSLFMAASTAQSFWLITPSAVLRLRLPVTR